MNLFTPFPVGKMPKKLTRWEGGPPFGRLDLDLDHDPADGEVVLDRNSWQWFRIEQNVDCGLGCRCAANARWVPSKHYVYLYHFVTPSQVEPTVHLAEFDAYHGHFVNGVVVRTLCGREVDSMTAEDETTSGIRATCGTCRRIAKGRKG